MTLSRTRSSINMSSNNNSSLMEQKRGKVVAVVYYLSRNGQLQHPHFLEVALSSPHGLFLRDVVHRLNLLRGKSMASHYSWSSKRSYKSGYVWHDLEENDLIYPVHDNEYVLKGSEILETTSSSVSKSPETSSSSSGKTNSIKSSRNSEYSASSVAKTRLRNQSWGAIDLHEYKVYKTESTQEFPAADASTQTDDKHRRRKAVIKEDREIEEEERKEKAEQCSMELSRGEISPPPSDSSPETLETLIKTDKRLIVTKNKSNSVNAALSTSSLSQTVDQADAGGADRTAGYCPSGRMKASSVLMSLISCGSISFRDCGATAVNDHGLSLISHIKPRLSCGRNQTMDDGGIKDDNDGMTMEIMEKNVSSSFAKMALEDKEYFSGSLIETNKKNYNDNHQCIALKRSSSYNSDRSCHMKLEKEVDGVKAKCIPRKAKAQPSNKKDDHISQITSSITSESPSNASLNLP
ncbi:hypothetical protein RND81_01G007400 [Saponaria officinalis]|uniref:SOSEKI DIX-like domain-containing protein n=1 Tax=Saponaria officinalis TaxID=3572 RepID=A0AAW1NBM1_SAPOF